MITNLKISCGLQLIKRLEGMMNDLNQAKDEIKMFEETAAFEK